MSISPKKKVSTISTTPTSLLAVGQVEDGWKMGRREIPQKYPRDWIYRKALYYMRS